MAKLANVNFVHSFSGAFNLTVAAAVYVTSGLATGASAGKPNEICSQRLAAAQTENNPMQNSQATATNEIMPKPEPNGFVRTLNGMGYMTSSLDPFTLKFIDFSVSSAPGPALDIGAAYGVATLEVLRKGGHVVANDLDARHLQILRNRTPIEFLPNLTLLPGRFPDELELAPGSVGAILISRVLHFFDGPSLESAAQHLFKWLPSGGKVFITAETPYLRNFRTFIEEYERRKAQGDPWPGFIEDVIKIAPERGKSLPKQMHLLDPDVLSRVFRAAGFKIEQADFFARPEFPEDLQLDGRESVGLSAVKP